jgi:hypothetical protein
VIDLERALAELGRELELPPAPDVAAAVRAQVQRRRLRPWLVVALAALLAVAVAFAVPRARAEILRFFHLRGVEVALVDRLPPLPAGAELLGAPTALDRLGFRPLLPYGGDEPDAVYSDDPQRSAWLVYGSLERPRLLLLEFRNDNTYLIKKVAASANTVQWVPVGESLGLWIAGPEHYAYLPGGAVHVGANTLLFDRDGLLVRIEGRFTRAQAVEVGLSLR